LYLSAAGGEVRWGGGLGLQGRLLVVGGLLVALDFELNPPLRGEGLGLLPD